MPFLRVRKATFTAFPHFRKVTSGARNKNLRPVLILALWRGNVVSNLLPFGHCKVVFSLFLILHRAFSHFMYLTFCRFRKRKMVQSWFQKLFWNQDCDVVGNLVVKMKFSIFVCLFVYLFVCTSRFVNFARRKWSNHNSKNCSEIRAVTPFWIWLWNFQFETFIFFTALYQGMDLSNFEFAYLWNIYQNWCP